MGAEGAMEAEGAVGAEGVEGAEEDEGAAIYIVLDGYDTTVIGYMALWGFCQRNSNHCNIYTDHAKPFIRLVVRGVLQLQ